MSNWQQTTIFIFTFTCMMLLCHQSSRSLDGSQNVCCHLVIKTCTASSYLARHGNCAELQKRKHAEKRKKTEGEPAEHRDCGTHKLCENWCSIYVITNITRFCLDGIELQWVIIQSQAWFRGYDLQCLLLREFWLRFRGDRRLNKHVLCNSTMSYRYDISV